jgi:general secretion pathway protein E
MVYSLADVLPAEQGPWHLDFERWPQAQAQRWRAVLAVGAAGRSVLLAERDADALLLQSVEARLQAPVRWLRCEAAAVEHWLGAGEADFRALSDVEEGVGAAAGEGQQAEELSALRLAEQASPVVRLLNATLYDALQDGASDVHIECSAS